MEETELSIIIGGQQGEGIESVGEILAKAMSRIGYHLFGARSFSSRIKGGHTDFNLRISKVQVFNNSEDLDIIIAFDEDTISLHQQSLKANGIILCDPKTVNINNINLGKEIRYHEIPLTQLAAELGSQIMKNIIAVGAACSLLNQPIEEFETAIKEQFEKKGKSIIENNLGALRKGYQYAKEVIEVHFPIEKATSGQRIFMSGNDAISLGAVLGGCRFMAGYPITPASEVLENLTRIIPEYGGVVVQTEDELAAISMVLGAGYTGARAMTATAGPGVSLMQEAIGLSGAGEIPVVIVDCQRGGPSSGMATKFEQSDLNAMFSGTHGESPRIILSPSTVLEAFTDMPKAFNLAEKFQCPVFVASDLMLATSKQTFDFQEVNEIEIDRGKLAGDLELFENEKAFYERFAITEDGITPRSIPGQKKGMHHVTGIEHGPSGHPSENPNNRKEQMDKRKRKLENVPLDQSIKYEGSQHPDILLIGFGSTYGVIHEARKKMHSSGIEVGHAHIRMLQPLAKDELTNYTGLAKKVFIIEQNSTGQLANIIKQKVAIHSKVHSILKYNGIPIKTSEIITYIHNHFDVSSNKELV
ncbi:2-oxoacid:acceptor oxidoreductase subunit alpha [Bacillus sp. ISL-47]|uniref:2-oxoacid:acceptor oxidoreductase subunit alpha n=1 Tax=Bacillus sp. ISL-47 TaxID=2819130 RepID=UPI001BEAF8DE|nr:2-oxoacid:acceptor oxidoreductase subunit alpha [Bacillus sp. ISL-47]MBT2689848.1 2-oxoacid:acceptor oxidoreductase subunit alpha [Bacillus sp. ISL-47]MBT2710225.1 2-oxoacid:acceptor oxidoreductase subunit alpha [Pseudomonas sp. ISL-84]